MSLGGYRVPAGTFIMFVSQVTSNQVGQTKGLRSRDDYFLRPIKFNQCFLNSWLTVFKLLFWFAEK
jgi:hypothetical protein